jgi:hypothetical protein
MKCSDRNLLEDEFVRAHDAFNSAKAHEFDEELEDQRERVVAVEEAITAHLHTCKLCAPRVHLFLNPSLTDAA